MLVPDFLAFISKCNPFENIVAWNASRALFSLASSMDTSSRALFNSTFVLPSFSMAVLLRISLNNFIVWSFRVIVSRYFFE